MKKQNNINEGHFSNTQVPEIGNNSQVCSTLKIKNTLIEAIKKVAKKEGRAYILDNAPISKSHLSELLSGKRTFTIDKLVMICDSIKLKIKLNISNTTK